MLKKALRLQKQEDFERVFRTGKSLFFGPLGCKMAQNKLSHVRLGFSLNKKHAESIVQRNRLRRVLSEAFYQALPEGESPSFDIVFFTVKKVPKKDLSTFARAAQSVVEYINQ
jgi:ribonuclease P protein component